MDPFLQENQARVTRRQLFGRGASGVGLAALASLLGKDAAAAQPGQPGLPHVAGKADRMIYLWQGGGPSHLDLFDPKPTLEKYRLQDLPASVRGTTRLSTMTAGYKKWPVLPAIKPYKKWGKSGLEISTLLPFTGEIADDIKPLQNVRLLNPGQMLERFRADEGLRSGLTIRDLDIDRYEVDGRVQQVVVAARELDLGSIALKSWQGRHLISTHGCGLVSAPVNRVETNGRPDYQPIELTRPELYFSEDLSGYAVVGTTVKEEACPAQQNAGPYSATGGIALDSVIKRMAFALEFLDYNLLGSSAVDDESRLLWIRNVRERVETVAPFLSFDADPYPVALDGGVVWIVDAYTTTARYPYAQNADRSQLEANSGFDFDFNYIRNSVKAVVNAYDGSMTFYIVDPLDPIVNAWASAFPKLFTPMAQMPDELASHLRYPEDLFRIQTDAYSKYRLDTDEFFDRGLAWSVAQGPPTVQRGTAIAGAVVAETAAAPADFAAESGSARFVPYYSMFRAPGVAEATFQMLRPFVPFSTNDSRKELQAFMVVSMDPGNYGKLTAYVVGTPAFDGPATVAAAIEQDSEISAELTLLGQVGSEVVYGDLQLVPISDGLLYIRPMYVKDEVTSQATFQYVLASYNGNAVFGINLRDALAKLFPGFRTDLGDVAGVDVEPEPGEPTDPGAPPSTETADELLAQAQDLFEQADEALPDFAKYDELNRQARELVAQALELLNANG